MTPDDIIRMAHEAGILEYGYPVGERVAGELERFASLVAAAEREACARICDERAKGWEMAAPARGDTEACMHHAAKNEARALGEAIRTGGVR